MLGYLSVCQDILVCTCTAGRASAGIATLEVLVKEAADLKGADVTGKSDPFCVIKFANQEQSTKHIPQTCSPKWNEKVDKPGL